MDENFVEIIVDKEEIKKKLLHSYQSYQKTMAYLLADAPIEVLCLSKPIQTILLNSGFLRVYDLLDCDFTKIKGLGKTRIRDLTASLDKFLSMS